MFQLPDPKCVNTANSLLFLWSDLIHPNRVKSKETKDGSGHGRRLRS